MCNIAPALNEDPYASRLYNPTPSWVIKLAAPIKGVTHRVTGYQPYNLRPKAADLPEYVRNGLVERR
jgi:hypothetical protein